MLGGNIDWSGRYGAHDLLTLLATGKGPSALILDTIRGPQVATALGAEAVFGLSGALFQTLFRNPLAAPDILGFTSCAGLAVVAKIALGLNLPMPLVASLGGLLAALLVALASLQPGRPTQPLTLILVSLGIGFLASALTTFLMTLLPNATTADAQRWMVGSLAARNWSRVLQVWLPGVSLSIAAAAQVKSLAVLELGDELLGIDVQRCRWASRPPACCLQPQASPLRDRSPSCP
ncbi:iron chelate uptake ABC transporter family permease subunit [Sulfitobacter sp. BDSS02]|nr:iron chelate uptake ABC transporter family permease subunit [Sulfitobacter sp. BDSS02]MBR9848152.1 iron ABC transporter permease [Paracoccaceae bacterium]